MTFAAREQHRLNGRPFFLYTFRFGSRPEDEIRYTNLVSTYDHDEKDYLSRAVEHSNITLTGNTDKTALTIRLPESDSLGALLENEPPSDIMVVTIRQVHVGDDDVKVAWSGRLVGHAFDKAHLVLTCEPLHASLRRNGLTRDYQYPCPLVLYGPQCRADKEAATIVRPVLAVNGPLVTLASDWEESGRKNKYVGGVAEWTDPSGRRSRRAIIRRNDDELTLSGLATGLAVDDELTLVLGCDHTMDDCRNLHANILNFGGQPEIPLVNPVGITNNFY